MYTSASTAAASPICQWSQSMIWLWCVCVSQERGIGVSVRRDEQVHYVYEACASRIDVGLVFSTSTMLLIQLMAGKLGTRTTWDSEDMLKG